MLNIEIQTDHQISSRRSEIVTKKKKKKTTVHIADFAVLADDCVKIKESKERYGPGPFLRIKHIMKQEGDGDTNSNRCTRNHLQGLVK